MRIIRNILLTLLCLAAVGAGVVFGYYQQRANREKALLEQGVALMEQGNYRSAKEKFAEARRFENSITRRLSSDTMEEDLFRYTAICDFHLGDYDEAEYVYDRLLVRHPKDPALLLGRGTVYAARGDMKEAELYLDMACSIDRSTYSRLYTAALTMREYGNKKAERKYLEKLLAEHGEEADPVIRGQSLCLLERFDEAAEVLGRIANPDMTTSLLLASAVEHTGDHERALEILDSVEDQTEPDPDVYNLRGMALCGLGKYDEALICFEKALPLAEEGTPVRQSILFNRIAVYEKKRDFARARELAAQYAEIYPNDDRMNRENLFLQTR